LPIDEPLVSVSATPSPITSVPSVATNAGTRKTVVISPLIKPISAPHASPAATPSGTLLCAAVITIAATTPETAMFAPIERSRSPPTMTNVVPTETMPRIAACSNISVILRPLRKYGESSVSATTSTSKMTGTNAMSIHSLRERPLRVNAMRVSASTLTPRSPSQCRSRSR
jgi:hypothetical protein